MCILIGVIPFQNDKRKWAENGKCEKRCDRPGQFVRRNNKKIKNIEICNNHTNLLIQLSKKPLGKKELNENVFSFNLNRFYWYYFSNGLSADLQLKKKKKALF